jgi:hypothetical protein
VDDPSLMREGHSIQDLFREAQSKTKRQPVLQTVRQTALAQRKRHDKLSVNELRILER